MSFNSTVFLACLPVVLILSYLLYRHPRGQNLFLLAFSLLFYGWWDARFLLLMVATILVDYTAALRMAAAGSPVSRRRWLGVSLVSNLGMLGTFKYYDFFTASFPLHLPLLKVALPIGISFYTFQSISYVLDVYWRRMEPVRRLADFALFVSFFPHLVAGPIMPARNLIPQLERPKRPTWVQAREGAYLLLYGFYLKIAIGDAAGRLSDYYFDDARRGWIPVLAGAVAFSLQIYGDFAGYSNIARGCAKLLGVELMVNFSNPYLSTSITEFWRRWHIALSTWLRDYLYIPLGGNRLGPRRAYMNLMIVMLLGGLWHGANWTFVVWGGLHGLYLVAHKWMLTRRPATISSGSVRVAKMLGVYLLVCLGWIFFRSPTLAGALGRVGTLLTLTPGECPTGLRHLAVIFCFLLPFEGLSAWRGREDFPLAWPWWARGVVYEFLVYSFVGGLGGNRSFIYFQF